MKFSVRRITLKLTRRADGRYAKVIDRRYFVWPDEKTARAELLDYIRQRDAGQSISVPAKPTDPQLRELANAFVDDRAPKVVSGTFSDYETAIDQFLACVGKFRRVSDLAPADFAKARKRWVATLGPWKLDNRVQGVRTMFRWACHTARLIDREPWYGDEFRKTTAADKRRVRRLHTDEHGERKFTADELRAILRRAKGNLRLFTLLALNGGMYAADIAQLRRADLRRLGRLWIIDNDRIKTGVRRKCVLWPETVVELEKVALGDDLLFKTLHGNPWVNGETNSIALLFGRLLRRAKIKRKGVGFGSLKHTHVSAVGGHPDVNAARLVRGHAVRGIEAHYDFPSLERLKAITDLARRKLLTSVAARSVKPGGAASRASSTRRPQFSSRRA